MVRRGIGAVVLVLLLAAADPPGIDHDRGDLDKLQGYWVRVSTVVQGKVQPLPEGTPPRLRVRGDMILFRLDKRNPEVFEIDPNSIPKEIDLTSLGDAGGPFRWRTARGIYKLDGPNLTLCFSVRRRGMRPMSFDTLDNPDYILHLYMRDGLTGPAEGSPGGRTALRPSPSSRSRR